MSTLRQNDRLCQDLNDPFRDPHLDRVLAMQIQERTGGFIDPLTVEVTSDRVVIVHGRIAGAYLRELAREAVLEVLGSDDWSQVELHITSGKAPM